MTVSQIETLQKLARRINAASFAVRALDTTPDHEAIEGLLIDIGGELRGLVEASR
jgi:hypothetical protein